MYQVKIKDWDKDSFKFEEGDLQGLDWVALGSGYYHSLLGGQGSRIRLVRVDYEEKIFVFELNGRRYTSTLKDKLDLLAERLGFGADVAKGPSLVKAPMPGLVLSLLVEEGQRVQKGDTLLILEAMKMENAIKAPQDAVVRKVAVVQGQAVEKLALLVSLESA